MMKCPFCGKEVVNGRISYSTRQMTTLVFLKDGEKMRFRDIFRNTTIESTVPPGLIEQEAFYCEECRKIITTFDAD